MFGTKPGPGQGVSQDGSDVVMYIPVLDLPVHDHPGYTLPRTATPAVRTGSKKLVVRLYMDYSKS